MDFLKDHWPYNDEDLGKNSEKYEKKVKIKKGEIISYSFYFVVSSAKGLCFECYFFHSNWEIFKNITISKTILLLIFKKGITDLLPQSKFSNYIYLQPDGVHL